MSQDMKVLLVELMNDSLACWRSEGMDVEGLFHHSRIWDMQSHGKSRRYYTPSLLQTGNPSAHIRWERVLASVDFVLQNCELNLKLLDLAIKRNKLQSMLSSHKEGQRFESYRGEPFTSVPSRPYA